jgi:hypothetical protein
MLPITDLFFFAIAAFGLVILVGFVFKNGSWQAF